MMTSFIVLFQLSWIILLFRGHSSNYIFIFNLFSEEISRKITIVLIKWDVSTIRNIGLCMIGFFLTHFNLNFVSLKFDVRLEGNIFSMLKVEYLSNNKSCSVTPSEKKTQTANWCIYNDFIEAKKRKSCWCNRWYTVRSNYKLECLMSDDIGVNFMTMYCLHSFILSKIGDTLQ